MAEFTYDDALNLYGLAYCQKHNGVPLYRDFFGALDGINRSAPTVDELAASLARLARLGLVRSAPDAEPAIVTDAGDQLYDKVNARPGTVFDRLRELTELLNQSPVAPASERGEIMPSVPVVDPAAFAAGHRAYYTS